MPRQVSVRQIGQPEQLTTVALELKPTAQQLKVCPRDWRRPFPKRIGEQVGLRAVAPASHVVFPLKTHCVRSSIDAAAAGPLKA